MVALYPETSVFVQALQQRTFIGFVFVACLPLLLVGLLLIIQHMIDAELEGRDYRCGCRCLSCCDYVPKRSASGNSSVREVLE